MSVQLCATAERMLEGIALPRTGTLLQAMRADRIPEGSRGSWRVRRIKQSVAQWSALRLKYGRGYRVTEVGRHTALECLTERTMHRFHGELVMLDAWSELRSHLGFVLKAEGEVLVNGLGLGCVVRGLLAKPEVRRVDVVEREEAVMDLVGQHMPADPRLHLHLHDAVAFAERTTRSWDAAWHDLWSDPGRREDDLVFTHTRLLVALRGRVGIQGAWALPRWTKRLLRSREAGSIV